MLILDKNLEICLKNIIIDIFEGVSLHFFVFLQIVLKKQKFAWVSIQFWSFFYENMKTKYYAYSRQKS